MHSDHGGKKLQRKAVENFRKKTANPALSQLNHILFFLPFLHYFHPGLVILAKQFICNPFVWVINLLSFFKWGTWLSDDCKVPFSTSLPWPTSLVRYCHFSISPVNYSDSGDQAVIIGCRRIEGLICFTAHVLFISMRCMLLFGVISLYMENLWSRISR